MVPGDIYIEEPASLVQACLAACRRYGAEVSENEPVTGISVMAGRVVGAETQQRSITAPVVVDAAGAWVRPVAELAGARIPVSTVRHQLLITAPSADVDPAEPITRVVDAAVYLRPARGRVAEALRYDCSLTSTPRFARRETIVGHRQLATGSAVFCLPNAANRDPERFPDPDRFDMMRTDKKHLSFGGGVHFCLGAPLARLQIEIALSALLRRYLGLRLGTARIEWRSGLYRGPVRVQVLTG